MAVEGGGTDGRKKFLDCETFPEILNHTARSSVRLVIEPTSSARSTNFDLGRRSRCSLLPSFRFKLSESLSGRRRTCGLACRYRRDDSGIEHSFRGARVASRTGSRAGLWQDCEGKACLQGPELL